MPRQAYGDLSREQLVALLERRDRERRLGLVWEREEIEADRAVNDDFVVMELDPDLSCGPGPWRNIIIEGDNYDALRWLRLTHRNKIRVTYIDPPYNRGQSDFLYNDRYVSGEDRFFHSTWLNFLEKRLLVYEQIAAFDSTFLASIDDAENAYFQALLRQTLGLSFLGNMVWRRRGTSAIAKNFNFSLDHEYILAMARGSFRFGGQEKEWQGYTNVDERGAWASADLTLGFTRRQRPNLFYPVVDPKTDILWLPNPNRVWAFARDRSRGRVRTQTMQELLAEDLIAFPNCPEPYLVETVDQVIRDFEANRLPTNLQRLCEDLGLSTGMTPTLAAELEALVGCKIGSGQPRLKKYREALRQERAPLSSYFLTRADLEDPERESINSQFTQDGTRLLTKVLGRNVFPYSKPLGMITSLLRSATVPNDIVLDFFAGSGTTGHAVLALNAEDDGDRRFILVGNREATAADPERNLVRDVCAERIRRVVQGYGGQPGLAGDFAYLRAVRIPWHEIGWELSDDRVWTTVQARFQLPLTPFDPKAPLQVAGSDLVAVAYLPAETQAAIDALAAVTAERFCHLFAWSPERLAPHLERLPRRPELHRLPDALTGPFRQARPEAIHRGNEEAIHRGNEEAIHRGNEEAIDRGDEEACAPALGADVWRAGEDAE